MSQRKRRPPSHATAHIPEESARDSSPGGSVEIPITLHKSLIAKLVLAVLLPAGAAGGALYGQASSHLTDREIHLGVGEREKLATKNDLARVLDELRKDRELLLREIRIDRDEWLRREREKWREERRIREKRGATSD